jgi:hypothetical protein
MDQVQIIAAASCAAGFGVGYLLAYYLTRKDLIRDVTMRIEAMHKVGRPMADMRNGQVPWAAIEKLLSAFPGQKP